MDFMVFMNNPFILLLSLNVQPQFLQEFIGRNQSHLADWLLGALADRKGIWH